MTTKLNKLICLVLAVLCMASFSVTAAAAHYASDESGAQRPPASIDSITVSTEAVETKPQNSGQTLTPDGDLDLIDDILQNEAYTSEEGSLQDKQFITIQTRDGSYFYLVIDRSGDSENVYFLNQVDVSDLQALLAEAGEVLPEEPRCSCTEKCTVGSILISCEFCRADLGACEGIEPEPEPEPVEPEPPEPMEPEEEPQSSAVPTLIIVLLAAAGGAVYWFFFRKRKPKHTERDDLMDDNLEDAAYMNKEE